MQCTRARFLSVILLSVAACTTGPTIRSHTDPAADLSRFRTFGFYSEPANGQAYAGFVSRYIESAVADEMQARGYVRSETPDLMINFHLQAEDKVQVTQTPATYYGWRRGYGWGGGAYHTDVRSYKEGTLNIDVVDRARNQLIWEGVAIGRINTKALDDPQPAIKSVVAQVFEHYPAGDNRRSGK
jgi:hypothetical protein